MSDREVLVLAIELVVARSERSGTVLERLGATSSVSSIVEVIADALAERCPGVTLHAVGGVPIDEVLGR